MQHQLNHVGRDPDFLTALEIVTQYRNPDRFPINFSTAQQAKQHRQPVTAVEMPTDDRSHNFYPEMGETRDPTKPILGNYVYNCYSIRWADADDGTVKPLLKKLRIRPKRPNGIKHVEYGDKNHYWHNSPFGKSGFFKALITMPAYSKLVDVGVISTETLLD